MANVQNRSSTNTMPNGVLKNDSAAMVEHHFMESNFLRQRLETFQSTIVRDFKKRINEEIEEVLQELRKHDLQLHEFKNFAQTQISPSSTWKNRISTASESLPTSALDSSAQLSKSQQAETPVSPASGVEGSSKASKRRALPDKVFVVRESYLTALLEVPHMKTIYHIFYIILSVLFMNSICYDYFVEGRVNFGLGTFKTGLAGIHYVLGIWLTEHVFVFMLYYAFKGWALVRAKLARQAPLQHFWSHSCLITYISAQLLFGYVASALCLKLNLPFVTASVLLLETTRLLMKMHAFVRTNAARIVAGKQKTDEVEQLSGTSAVQLAPFSSYLYFLFAPTLVYRDHYPRTTQIRWKFALARFLEVVAVAFVYSYIHERHIKVHFANYGREELNASLLIVKIFGMIMPSVIIFLCGFYMILHSWLNFTAELLRFGDRMFYKDWWTSHSYDAYYRNWNVVVHDWLYEYIYKDVYNHIFGGSKLAASLMVFFTSALVHEHLIGTALQVFFPIMFVLFAGVGVSLVFVTRVTPKTWGNIIIWFSLIIGNGLMISLYCMEYYARFNCPKTYASWVDYITPAIANCYRN